MYYAAGWYVDQQNQTVERYWDGARWTAWTRPRQVPIAAAPQTRRRTWPWLVGAAVLLLFVLAGLTVPHSGSDSATSATTTKSTVVRVAVPKPARPAPTATTETVVVPLALPPQTVVSEVPTTPPASTTTIAPTTSTPSNDLESRCSEDGWREAMGTEGDRLCGSVWTPRTVAAPVLPIPTDTPEAPGPQISDADLTPPVPDEPSGATVHPGSFCGTPGATGVTSKGTPMVCGPAADGEDRWHSAG